MSNTILALGLTLSIALAFGAWFLGRVRAACRDGAVKLRHELEATFRGEHSFAVVRKDEVPDLDETTYQALEARLFAAGFQYLGSLEDQTVSEISPHHRTRADCYANGDGSIGASIFLMGGHAILEFSSRLDDGRFLVTTNAEVNKLTPPPRVLRVDRAEGTNPDELLALHGERLRTLLSQDPALRVFPYRRMDDTIETARELSRIGAEYRQSIGYLTEDELHRMAKGGGQAMIARVLWEEYRKVADEGRRAA